MATATGLLGLDSFADHDALQQVPPPKWAFKRSLISQRPLHLTPSSNAHIYAFPVELWRTIFHHVLMPLYEKPRFPLRRDERDSPDLQGKRSSSSESKGREQGTEGEKKDPSFHLDLLALGQVCSLWRAITFVTPILWSTIQVYNPTPAAIRYVQYWLWQSNKFIKPEPLSLSLRCDSRYLWTMRDIGATQITQTILRLFLDNLPRWKTLTLECYFKEDYLPLVNAPFHKAKLLETVDIRSYSARDDLNIQLWERVLTSPVRRFIWHGKSFPSIDTTPWTQFTHLTLPCCYFETYLKLLPILAKSTRLEYLSIEAFMASDFWIDTSPFQTAKALRFSRLRTLCLRGCTVDSGLFLQYLITPSLDGLLIKQRDTRDPLRPHLFHDFLDRSKCQLKTLSLNLLTSHQTDLDDIFLKYLQSAYLSRVQNVSLYGDCLGDTLIQALILKPKFDLDRGGVTSGLLPYVKELTLQKCRPSKDGLIADLLRSRIKLHVRRRASNGSSLYKPATGVVVKKKKSRASNKSVSSTSSASSGSSFYYEREKRVVFDGRSLEYFSLTYALYDEHPVDADMLWAMFQAGLKGAQRC